MYYYITNKSGDFEVLISENERPEKPPLKKALCLSVKDLSIINDIQNAWLSSCKILEVDKESEGKFQDFVWLLWASQDSIKEIKNDGEYERCLKEGILIPNANIKIENNLAYYVESVEETQDELMLELIGFYNDKKAVHDPMDYWIDTRNEIIKELKSKFKIIRNK